jgi:protein subunit release factor B
VRNKRKTGVRITHTASGAVGESRQHRTQGQNKKAALRRLVDHPEMKRWIRIQTARSADLGAKIDRMMQAVRVEVHRGGKWIEE